MAGRKTREYADGSGGYEVGLSIEGPTGVATLITAWRVREGQATSLVTARPRRTLQE